MKVLLALDSIKDNTREITKVFIVESIKDNIKAHIRVRSARGNTRDSIREATKGLAVSIRGNIRDHLKAPLARVNTMDNIKEAIKEYTADSTRYAENMKVKTGGLRTQTNRFLQGEHQHQHQGPVVDGQHQTSHQGSHQGLSQGEFQGQHQGQIQKPISGNKEEHNVQVQVSWGQGQQGQSQGQQGQSQGHAPGQQGQSQGQSQGQQGQSQGQSQGQQGQSQGQTQRPPHGGGISLGAGVSTAGISGTASTSHTGPNHNVMGTIGGSIGPSNGVQTSAGANASTTFLGTTIDHTHTSNVTLTGEGVQVSHGGQNTIDTQQVTVAGTVGVAVGVEAGLIDSSLNHTGHVSVGGIDIAVSQYPYFFVPYPYPPPNVPQAPCNCPADQQNQQGQQGPNQPAGYLGFIPVLYIPNCHAQKSGLPANFNWPAPPPPEGLGQSLDELPAQRLFQKPDGSWVLQRARNRSRRLRARRPAARRLFAEQEAPAKK
uniref:Uncharacterized protein n=1 Tax=Anopheles christyi TaxID=43041 RepID=A0A182K937_9DIPT